MECGKRRSTGETGFSTEGNKGKQMADEAPKQHSSHSVQHNLLQSTHNA